MLLAKNYIDYHHYPRRYRTYSGMISLPMTPKTTLNLSFLRSYVCEFISKTLKNHQIIIVNSSFLQSEDSIELEAFLRDKDINYWNSIFRSTDYLKGSFVEYVIYVNDKFILKL
jgi:hypothetical protein